MLRPKCSGSISRPAFSALAWIRSLAACASFAVTCAPSEPVGDPANTVKRLRPTTPEPDLERILDGPHNGRQPGEGPTLGRVLDGLACLPSAEQSEHFLEYLTRPASPSPSASRSPGAPIPVTKLSNNRPLEMRSTLRQFLGKQKRVAPQWDHVRPQPQARRPSRNERQAEQRIDHRRERGRQIARSHQSRWPRSRQRTPAARRLPTRRYPGRRRTESSSDHGGRPVVANPISRAADRR